MNKCQKRLFFLPAQIGCPDLEDSQMSDTRLMARRPGVTVATSEAASDLSRPRQQRLRER